MRKLHILFVRALLLISCDHSQVEDITPINGSLSSQREIRTPKESHNSHVIIHIPEKAEEADLEVARNGFTFQGIEIPDEVMLQVFRYLSVTSIAQASQVCQGWYQLSEEPELWRAIRLHIHGDYPASEATKEQARLHRLRVYVHTLTDLTKAKDLIDKHGLNKHRPFVSYQALAYALRKKPTAEIIDEQAIQGNEEAIERKIRRLAKGRYGSKKDRGAAVTYNEYLIDQQNEKAITRKLNGLEYGEYGYTIDLEANITYTDHMVNQGNEKAIRRKIVGLANGMCYKEDEAAAFALNEHFINQGNEKAIKRKFMGLVYRGYGYNKDLPAAFSLNEYWVEQGSIKAMERKIHALAYGIYGYERNPVVAFTLNEQLVNQGSEKAIKRKLIGLAYGRYGYNKDWEAAITYNEQLIEQGNEKAIIRKVKQLSQEIDNNSYTDNSLAFPIYTKDLPKLRIWLEEESKKTRWACYLKAKGLKYGILGFTKNRDAAVAYIKKHHIPY